MIYERENTFTHTGNMMGEKIALSFDETAHQHLMDQLTELYSDPEAACIREYTTNAHDAHVEAGQTRPIEVTTPSPLNPSALIIRDFGTGLNAQDVKDVYSKYGASTKRESNDFNGMLGFGCKAALAYSNSFTVASVKDGMRTQILCARDEDGAASMTVLYEGPSDDPNGTEISIPAARGNDFERKARELFAHWPKGSVLLNGAEPTPAEGIRVNDEFLITYTDRYSRGGNNAVVMGGVRYPADFTDTLAYGYAVVAYLPIGAVNIAPSREALKYTDKTKRALAEVEQRFSQATQGFIEKSVDAETTATAALAKYLELAPIFGLRTYRHAPLSVSWRGQPLPGSITWPGTNVLEVPVSAHRVGAHDKVTDTNVTVVPRALIFTGYTPTKFTPTHKKKLNQWIQKQDLGPVSTYVLTDAKTVKNQWVDPARVFKWDDVAAEKLPKAYRNPVTSKVSGSFDIITPGGMQYEVLASDFDTKLPMYYHVGTKGEAHGYKGFADDLAPKGYTLVTMGSNRENKFKRDFPNAKPIRSAIKDAFDAWVKSLSADDKAALTQYEHDNNQRVYAAMNAAKVTDPELQRAIRLAKRDVNSLIARYRAYQYAGHRLNLSETAPKRPLKSYPLFDYSKLIRHEDEMVAYLNWQYSQRAKKS